jgi:hypothetical protein
VKRSRFLAAVTASVIWASGVVVLSYLCGWTIDGWLLRVVWGVDEWSATMRYADYSRARELRQMLTWVIVALGVIGLTYLFLRRRRPAGDSPRVADPPSVL